MIHTMRPMQDKPNMWEVGIWEPVPGPLGFKHSWRGIFTNLNAQAAAIMVSFLNGGMTSNHTVGFNAEVAK